MAFPWITEATFEGGTGGHFEAETDTGSKLDIVHYSTLAQFAGLPAPWRGAYCLRADLRPNTTAAYLNETGSWDTSVGSTFRAKFMFWLGGPGFAMTDTDEFAIFQCMAGTNTTVQAGVYVNFTTANGYRLGLGGASASNLLPLSLNRWHSVEIALALITNASTIDGWLDNSAFVQTDVSNAGAMTDGRIGIIGQDRAYAGGFLLFDDVVTDDARMFSPERRWQNPRVLTQSEHVFVGPGELLNVTLLGGGTNDSVLTVYDTDAAYVSDEHNIVGRVRNTADNEVVDLAGVPIQVHRGCYVELTGTDPRALIQIGRAAGYWSDAAVRNVGIRRVARTPLA